jgi:hypothetical protein
MASRFNVRAVISGPAQEKIDWPMRKLGVLGRGGRDNEKFYELLAGS